MRSRWNSLSLARRSGRKSAPLSVEPIFEPPGDAALATEGRTRTEARTSRSPAFQSRFRSTGSPAADFISSISATMLLTLPGVK